jgi:hypothetical protein
MNVPRRFRFPTIIKTLPRDDMTEYEKWKAGNHDKVMLWDTLRLKHGVKRDPLNLGRQSVRQCSLSYLYLHILESAKFHTESHGSSSAFLLRIMKMSGKQLQNVILTRTSSERKTLML